MAGRQYTHALVTRVSQGFCPKTELIEAKEQHETFVTLLRDLGLDVIELAPDETLPLGVFIEDTAVVVNGTALITRPGDVSRQKEVAAVRVVLKRDLHLPIVEMADETARLDGGDVLFTGREFFVGLSSKTNEAGARAVAAAFPEFPTTPVPVPGSTHLKNLVSVAGPEVLCVAGTKSAQELIKRIEREATFSYSTLTVPEEAAANVLYINGTLIHRTEDEIPNSHSIFAEKVLKCTMAPVLDNDEEGQTHIQEYFGQETEASGCYYNFQHYDEGDRIITNEPCLNCTCHNRMLMCYLRVCPFTKAIGQDCTVEKQADQCCPIINCPEVPVQLLTSSTTEHSETALPQIPDTSLGHLDDFGCRINDIFYTDGAQTPSDPAKPCELCYCIRNRTACVMQECTLRVEGCRPIYEEGVCCPVRYQCDYEDESKKTTTTTEEPRPTPGLILTTTAPGPLDCKHNGETYLDGTSIVTEGPCEHCYCMRGEIVCAVQECGTPLDKQNCTALPPPPGKCCPETYHCDQNEIEDGSDSTNRQNRKHDDNVNITTDIGVPTTEPVIDAEVSEIYPRPQKPSSVDQEEAVTDKPLHVNEIPSKFDEEHAPVTDKLSTEHDNEIKNVISSTSEKVMEEGDHSAQATEAPENEPSGESEEPTEPNLYKDDEQTTEEEIKVPEPVPSTESTMPNELESSIKPDQDEVVKPENIATDAPGSSEPESNEGHTNDEQSTEIVNLETGYGETQTTEKENPAVDGSTEIYSENPVSPGQEEKPSQENEDESSGAHEVTESTAEHSKPIATDNLVTSSPAAEDHSKFTETSHGGQSTEATPETISHIPGQIIFPKDENEGEEEETGTANTGLLSSEVSNESEDAQVTQTPDLDQKLDLGSPNPTAANEVPEKHPHPIYSDEVPTIVTDVPMKNDDATIVFPHDDEKNESHIPVDDNLETNKPLEGTVTESIPVNEPTATHEESDLPAQVPSGLNDDKMNQNTEKITGEWQSSEISINPINWATTQAPPLISQVPGEGSCLVDKETYRNNTDIPPAGKCQTSCRCISSTVHCVLVNCPPPPPGMKQCAPSYRENECCPTYMCDSEDSPTLQSGSQVTEDGVTLVNRFDGFTTESPETSSTQETEIKDNSQTNEHEEEEEPIKLDENLPEAPITDNASESSVTEKNSELDESEVPAVTTTPIKTEENNDIDDEQQVTEKIESEKPSEITETPNKGDNVPEEVSTSKITTEEQHITEQPNQTGMDENADHSSNDEHITEESTAVEESETVVTLSPSVETEPSKDHVTEQPIKSEEIPSETTSEINDAGLESDHHSTEQPISENVSDETIASTEQPMNENVHGSDEDGNQGTEQPINENKPDDVNTSTEEFELKGTLPPMQEHDDTISSTEENSHEGTEPSTNEHVPNNSIASTEDDHQATDQPMNENIHDTNGSTENDVNQGTELPTNEHVPDDTMVSTEEAAHQGTELPSSEHIPDDTIAINEEDLHQGTELPTNEHVPDNTISISEEEYHKGTEQPANENEHATTEGAHQGTELPINGNVPDDEIVIQQSTEQPKSEHSDNTIASTEEDDLQVTEQPINENNIGSTEVNPEQPTYEHVPDDTISTAEDVHLGTELPSNEHVPDDTAVSTEETVHQGTEQPLKEHVPDVDIASTEEDLHQGTEEPTNEYVPDDSIVSTEETVLQGTELPTKEHVPDGDIANTEEDLHQGTELPTNEHVPEDTIASNEEDLHQGTEQPTNEHVPDGHIASTEDDLHQGTELPTNEHVPEDTIASNEEDLHQGTEQPTNEHVPDDTIAITEGKLETTEQPIKNEIMPEISSAETPATESVNDDEAQGSQVTGAPESVTESIGSNEVPLENTERIVDENNIPTVSPIDETHGSDDQFNPTSAPMETVASPSDEQVTTQPDIEISETEGTPPSKLPVEESNEIPTENSEVPTTGAVNHPDEKDEPVTELIEGANLESTSETVEENEVNLGEGHEETKPHENEITGNEQEVTEVSATTVKAVATENNAQDESVTATSVQSSPEESNEVHLPEENVPTESQKEESTEKYAPEQETENEVHIEVTPSHDVLQPITTKYEEIPIESQVTEKEQSATAAPEKDAVTAAGEEPNEKLPAEEDNSNIHQSTESVSHHHHTIPENENVTPQMIHSTEHSEHEISPFPTESSSEVIDDEIKHPESSTEIHHEEENQSQPEPVPSLTEGVHNEPEDHPTEASVENITEQVTEPRPHSEDEQHNENSSDEVENTSIVIEEHPVAETSTEVSEVEDNNNVPQNTEPVPEVSTEESILPTEPVPTEDEEMVTDKSTEGPHVDDLGHTEKGVVTIEDHDSSQNTVEPEKVTPVSPEVTEESSVEPITERVQDIEKEPETESHSIEEVSEPTTAQPDISLETSEKYEHEPLETESPIAETEVTSSSQMPELNEPEEPEDEQQTERADIPTESSIIHEELTTKVHEVAVETSPTPETPEEPIKITEAITQESSSSEPEVIKEVTELPAQPLMTSTTEKPVTSTSAASTTSEGYIYPKPTNTLPVKPSKPPTQEVNEPYDHLEEDKPQVQEEISPEDDYDEEEEQPYGPGTCRYAGKVYVSAQQIPRDDPCDFCFCFRSDIICLQQSCPPPIPGCHEEPISGFCCPRYECHVRMATMMNVTSTTTTTTTTLPPHFLAHAYKGAASKMGCLVQGRAYSVGQSIDSASGPCMDCICGGDGNMKCEPKVCTPEPMIRKMMVNSNTKLKHR